MFQRLVLTIATAVGLTGLFVVYTLVMRPIVVIPARPLQITEISQDSHEEMPEEYQRVAKTYLKGRDQQWAETAPQAVRADNAFIYTRDWHRDEANFKRVHLTKFAMVWLVNGGEANEEAYSIVSDSVQLEFDSEMDERKLKNPGRVVKARFEDNVHISGPNGLEIVGRDFFFDESLLLLETWSPVRIKYLKHFAYAPRMQIRFLPGQGVPRLDRPHVSGIDYVKLIGGPNPREPENFKVVLSTTIPRGKEGETVPAIVKCTGDLIYTVASNIVVLNEDVRGKIGKSPTSTFISANRLTIGLVPKPAVAGGGTRPAPGNALATEGFQVPNTNLEFGRMLAEGLNGELVTIMSDEQGIKSYMARMEYTVETQIVSMMSANPTQAVRLYRGQSSLTAPRVDVQLGTGAKTTFESLLCLGKGEIQYFNDETQELEFRALWKRHLSLKKDDQPGLHVVELDEEARFLQKKRATGLLANQVKVWLANLNLSVDTSPPGGSTSEKKQDSEPKPRRMVALGNVAMTSDRLQIIEAKELDVVIEDTDVRQAVRTAPKSRAGLQPTEATASNQSHSIRTVRKQPIKKSPGVVVGQSTRNRVVGFANVPAESDRGSEFDTLEELPAKSTGRAASSSPPSAKPIDVRAGRIVAHMYRVPGNENPLPKSIHCEGNVNITQEGESGKKALVVDGDIVDLNSQAVDQEVIRVLGKPAVIKAQNYRIEGRDINLDLAANRAWVKGVGVLALPIPPGANLPGMAAAAAPDLQIRWEESMDFDGLHAKFLRGIQANSGLMKLHCEQMTVEMVARMSFRAVGTSSSKSSGKAVNPELKTIRCQENVRFENTVRGPGNRVTGVYRGNVGDFTINQVTGKVEAQGPGKIRVWERQNKTQSASATQNIIQANSPLPAEVSLWDFTFFEFEGKMNGSFSPKENSSAPASMTINDRVRVTRGPVEGPPLEVKSDKLPSMGISIRCNQLKVAQNPKSKQNERAFVELVGIGNTEVEGRVNKDQFQASGDDMSYDGANGNIKLRANGRRQAMIRGIFNNTAQSMEFNPGFPTLKDRFIKIDGATDGNAKP